MKAGDLAPKTSVANTPSSVPQVAYAAAMSVPLMTINPNDPYDIPEERAEANDWFFTKFFAWTGNGGAFSSWRERHIFMRGFRNGWGTRLFAKFSECPEMWLDEGQYYEAGQEFGYVFKVGFDITAVFIATQLGVIAVIGGVDVPATVELNKDNISTLIQQVISIITSKM